MGACRAEDRAGAALAEAKRLLSCKAIDVEFGDKGGKFSECFRIDANGKIVNTQYKLVSRESSYRGARAARNASRETRNPNASYGYSYGWGWSNGGWYPYQEQRRYYGYDGYQRGSWGGGWGSWGAGREESCDEARASPDQPQYDRREAIESQIGGDHGHKSELHAG